MSWLLPATVKISILIVIALLATALLRRRSAAVRHFVMAIALACALLIPLVQLVAPAWRAGPALRVVDRPLAVLTDITDRSAAATVTSRDGRRTSGASIIRAAAALWIGGATVAVLMIGAGLLRLRSIASRSRPVVGGPLTTAAAGIGLAYGLRTPPRLRLAEEPAVLGTFGITRATILLPAAACDWPADRIHIVLAHELAHVRRGDWLVQTLAELVRAVYWFNPLIWLACRRLRLESEQACDDVVLTLGVESSAYAAELVDLALAFHARRRPLVPAAAIARPSHLERRIRAMLNATINRDPITRSASIAAAVVLAALTVLIAGFGVSAQAQFGSVAGTVSDQHGRAIGGVTLVLANPTAQTKHEVKTDPAGHYEIVGVPTGTYELTFQMPGMSTLKREGLTVASAPVQVNAVMQIGSIVETITVNSTADTAPLVRGSSGPTPAAKPDACATSANGGCIRPPVKIKDVRPVFPPGASVDPPGTVVILSARIDANGYVTDVQVLRAIDPVLAASAIEAVRLWEYLPTQLDGQPIDARMTVLVNFTK